jgi:hypothetical protein
MEHITDIKIEVEINSNKATIKVAFDNWFDAAEYILEKLSDEEVDQLIKSI